MQGISLKERLLSKAIFKSNSLYSIPSYAGPPGVEPGKAVLETAVIPFHHRPKVKEFYLKK